MLLSKILLAIFLADSSFSTIINTQHGPVLGATRVTETNRMYYSFQGIPYAQPSDGPLRFRDPLPPIPWVQPLNCTIEGSRFWGVNDITGKIDGSFDSLHVNVFTNNLSPVAAYPVLVWIHGGAFRSGSSSTDFYGPDYLMEENVVVVSLNYRLAAFGFLTLDDPSLLVPGNAGLKDQRLALQWVQKNIANFGGDPTRVLLFGHSAGGSSVHFHMISPNSENLFHRGFASGSNALQNVVYTPRRQWAQQLAYRLGLNSSDESEILSFLEQTNPVDIVREQDNLLTVEEFLAEGFANVFGPAREPYNTEGVFLNDELSTLLQNAWGNRINLIFGATSLENLPMIMTFRSSQEALATFSNFEIYIPREAGVVRNTEASRKYSQMIRNNYYPVLQPSVTNIDGLLKVSSDMDLWYGIHRSVRFRMQAGNLAPTYVMRFDADTENAVFKRFFNEIDSNVKLYREPIHGDEFSHFFKTFRNVPISEMTAEGFHVLRLMVLMLTNFAATGNPSIPAMNITWTPVPVGGKFLTGLNVNENLSEVMILPEADRMHAFDEIFVMQQKNGASKFSFATLKIFLMVLIAKLGLNFS